MYSGKVVSESGKVIFRRVTANLVTDASRRFTEWGGILTVVSGEPAGNFTGILVTDCGGRAKISATLAVPGTDQLVFKGEGGLPVENA